MGVAKVDHDDSNAHHLTAQEVRQHAGPWLIALGVAIKSLLALVTAIGLEICGAQRMHGWIGLQIERFNLDPDHGFLATLLDQTRDDTVHLLVSLLIAYASVHGAEAWGLWRDKPWASWLGCIGAMLYFPVDVTELWRHPGWLTASLVMVNLLVVLILGWNIHNLRLRRAAIDR